MNMSMPDCFFSENLDVTATTSDKYATAFGFAEKEVFNALDGMGLGDEKEDVKNGMTVLLLGATRIFTILGPYPLLSGKMENTKITGQIQVQTDL